MLKKSTKTKKKLESTELPGNLSDDVYKKALSFQFSYSVIGIISGILIVLFGIHLTISGFDTTSEEVTIDMLGANLNLKKVTSGVILFFIGLFVIYITRYVVKSKNN